MNKLLITAVVMAASGFVSAKIPAPVLDDAAKAKAAEAAAKTGWQAKVDNYLLCKSQDKVAAHYRKTAAAMPAKAAAPGATPAVAAPAAAAAPAAKAAVPGGTAVAVAGPPTPTPCADPGPFAFTPPEQKPLEAAGAHSPAGNAASPPSSKTPAAAMPPAKKS